MANDRGRRGLIALALTLITVLVFGLVDIIKNKSHHKEGHQEQTYSDDCRGNHENGENGVRGRPAWPNMAARAGCDHCCPDSSTSELYAQWFDVMISAVAAGISAWAVFLLRDTLRETRNAVGAANESNGIARDIGQAQTRAYVSVSLVNVAPNKDWPKFTVRMTIRNTGQTPTRALMYGAVLTVGTGGVSERPLDEVRVHRHATKELTSGESDGSIEIPLEADTSMTGPPEIGGSIKAWALIETKFTDVFNVLIVERVWCSGFSTWPAEAGIPMDITKREIRASPESKQA